MWRPFDPQKRKARRSVGFLAWLAIVLTGIAPCQKKPLLPEEAWSGGAQCQIEVQGPGYTHQETHSWTLSGNPPIKQGAMKIYSATWSVSGQGSLDRTQGAQTLKAEWTTNASLANAPIALFIRASDGKRVIKSWHAQLRSAGGVTGTQEVTINGVVQNPKGVISLEAFEWTFPLLEGVRSSGVIAGSSAKPTNGSVGPMQPGGSQGSATCNWEFHTNAPAAPAK